MASGLPVLATAVGANPQLVDEGRTGYVVPAGNPDALANGLLRLASDPNRAKAMGEQGRAEVEKRFSLASMVAGYEAVYERML
mgnify:CR=1 FL=1